MSNSKPGEDFRKLQGFLNSMKLEAQDPQYQARMKVRSRRGMAKLLRREAIEDLEDLFLIMRERPVKFDNDLLRFYSEQLMYAVAFTKQGEVRKSRSTQSNASNGSTI